MFKDGYIASGFGDADVPGEAGWGIEAGTTIKIKLRIFAGLCMWRKPKPEEMEIRCKRLESGEVCYGTLIESGESKPGEAKEQS